MNHDGGDAFDLNDISIQVDGEEISNGELEVNEDEVDDDNSDAFASDGEISTGDTIAIPEDELDGDDDVEDADEITVIHDPSDSIIYDSDL